MSTIAWEAVNGLDAAAFAATFGGIFEHSPWVAERAFAARPFAGLDDLNAAMRLVVRLAAREEKLALIRAHPDLAGKAARAGTLTASSAGEQASAGLDRLSDAEFERFHRANEAYRRRFGFPFIICVRKHAKASILAAFDARLGNGAEAEIEAALAEIYDIARLRLEALVAVSGVGRLSTHVLDTASGRPAAGMRIDFSRIGPAGEAVLVKSLATNKDGRTDAPIMIGAEFATGSYELLFHAGDYFAAQGAAPSSPRFIDRVPIRFAIAEPKGHYHVPLLVSPWSYSTYRGS